MPGSENIEKQFAIYIVRCCDGTYYTGLTTDLDRRIERHNSPGKETWSKYTKARQPVELVYNFPGIKSKRAAYVGEYYIKSLKRKGKELLINGDEKAVGLLEDLINLESGAVSKKDAKDIKNKQNTKKVRRPEVLKN